MSTKIKHDCNIATKIKYCAYILCSTFGSLSYNVNASDTVSLRELTSITKQNMKKSYQAIQSNNEYDTCQLFTYIYPKKHIEISTLIAQEWATNIPENMNLSFIEQKTSALLDYININSHNNYCHKLNNHLSKQQTTSHINQLKNSIKLTYGEKTYNNFFSIMTSILPKYSSKIADIIMTKEINESVIQSIINMIQQYSDQYNELQNNSADINEGQCNLEYICQSFIKQQYDPNKTISNVLRSNKTEQCNLNNLHSKYDPIHYLMYTFASFGLQILFTKLEDIQPNQDNQQQNNVTRKLFKLYEGVETYFSIAQAMYTLYNINNDSQENKQNALYQVFNLLLTHRAHICGGIARAATVVGSATKWVYRTCFKRNNNAPDVEPAHNNPQQQQNNDQNQDQNIQIQPEAINQEIQEQLAIQDQEVQEQPVPQVDLHELEEARAANIALQEQNGVLQNQIQALQEQNQQQLNMINELDLQVINLRNNQEGINIIAAKLDAEAQ